MNLRGSDLHARIGAARWPSLLAQLGIEARFLVKRNGPCPSCGGRDRFQFDNRSGRGDFFCRGCKPGDGFDLLMRVQGWSFAETRRRVIEALGGHVQSSTVTVIRAPGVQAEIVGEPPQRVRLLFKRTCAIADCPDAVQYLAGRGLWPLPEGCTWRAHATVDYFQGQQLLGRFPALVAVVRDIDGHIVTAHVTYLQHGAKLAGREPRKLLSALTGRAGCAVRLMPCRGDTLGLSEGLETALAAARVSGLPTWAALNTSLLARFEPPAGVRRLVVFADRDVAGLEAAGRLMEHLQGRVVIELRPPRAPAKDYADCLLERAA